MRVNCSGEDDVKRLILFLSTGGHFVRLSRTICAILVEGIMRNISVKLYVISQEIV